MPRLAQTAEGLGKGRDRLPKGSPEGEGCGSKPRQSHMGIDEGLALVGVEFDRESPAKDGLLEAVQE